MHLEVLAGVAVRERRDLLSRGAQDHLAVVAPGGRGGIARRPRQGINRLRHSPHHGVGEGARGRKEPSRALVPVLGLADEIGGDDRRVGALVGDDRDLRRPGEDIDADTAEQHALRLGDEFVAGADDDIGGTGR